MISGGGGVPLHMVKFATPLPPSTRRVRQSVTQPTEYMHDPIIAHET